MKSAKVLFIVILISMGVSCTPKQVNTEPISPTWYANQVAIRINELSKTVIELNKTGQISTDTTRVFGEWATTALKTLNEVPNGWQKTLQTGWNEAKAKLPQTNPTIVTAIAIVDTLITILNPPGV